MPNELFRKSRSPIHQKLYRWPELYSNMSDRLREIRFRRRSSAVLDPVAARRALRRQIFRNIQMKEQGSATDNNELMGPWAARATLHQWPCSPLPNARCRRGKREAQQKYQSNCRATALVARQAKRLPYNGSASMPDFL